MMHENPGRRRMESDAERERHRRRHHEALDILDAQMRPDRRSWALTTPLLAGLAAVFEPELRLAERLDHDLALSAGTRDVEQLESRAAEIVKRSDWVPIDVLHAFDSSSRIQLRRTDPSATAPRIRVHVDETILDCDLHQPGPDRILVIVPWDEPLEDSFVLEPGPGTLDFYFYTPGFLGEGSDEI